ncbi:hypothetical protein ACT29H_01835 [Thermophagus sp. OGC60D27]|uniref:hypothetical protein n=1 Tax=Thermophagus sp. OGC60D27 TaxID=3458415 RepID=UPI0040384AFE
MLEYHNNILCIEGGWLHREGIMSKSNYDSLIARGRMKVVRKGGGPGRPALIQYDSVPDRFRVVIEARIGDPRKKARIDDFEKHIIADNHARSYYSSFKLPDGRHLPDEVIAEYSANADILNAIHRVITKRIGKRKALGGRVSHIWESVAKTVEQLKDKYKHSLPSNPRRLKERYKKYMEDGYHALIHKGYCNSNSRKVTADLERLILSLYAMPNKPFAASVHDLYLQFLSGAIEVVDYDTGEIYDRNDFFDKNGVPVMISESTVWNYINNPKNRLIVDKARNDSLAFNTLHRPHHHRHGPQFSLSKISLDDRDLPRKLEDGSRVKAYYAYDVLSGCVIGAAYSKHKDKDLFINCVRDMFRFLDRNNMGTPAEVEVEHHLVNKFKDDLMQAGIIFPFVRWCNPGNSQEKYAETMNRVKKYGYEKRYQDGIGRFYSKLEANRPKVEKTWDEEGMKVREKTYTFDQIVADDRFVIEKFNNSLHPNQKLFPGMTRMQVLKRNQNPELTKIDRAILVRYIGEHTRTSIRRSQYVTVLHEKYQLPTPEVLGKLMPNNYTVDAYYLPTEDGIDEVYLYQGQTFICKANKIKTYNTATAEQTEEDLEAYTQQAKYVSKFDKIAKEGKASLAKLHVIENEEEDNEDIIVETVPDTSNSDDFGFDDFTDDDEFNIQRALDSL